MVMIWSDHLMAISSHPVLERFKLVGVIEDRSRAHHGIAVIKDLETKKTLTLKLGDQLVRDASWVISKIRAGAIEVSSWEEHLVIPHLGRVDQPEDLSPPEELSQETIEYYKDILEEHKKSKKSWIKSNFKSNFNPQIPKPEDMIVCSSFDDCELVPRTSDIVED